jgi:BASS family bile acid:Na+ symporter
MAVALLLLAAAPSAPVATYYAQLARGSVALAITTTAVSSVMATGMTPLVAAQGFRLALGSEAAFTLPVGRVAHQLLIVLLLPVAAGMALRALAPAWVAARRPLLQGLSLVAIAVVVGGVLGDQWTVVRYQLAGLLPAAGLFTAALLAAGAVAVKAALPPGPDRRAVLWGFPARNVALAVLLADGALGERPVAAAVAVAFVVQACLAVPLAYWLGRQHRVAVPG